MNVMTIVFFLLSAALLLLAVLLLWFVPHLLGQQEMRSAREAQRLRQLLADVLGEQEAVALRQSQLGSSLNHLREQLEQVHSTWPAVVEELVTQPAATNQPMLEHLDNRLGHLQTQLEGWMDERKRRLHNVSSQENESWAYLMSLLGTMQDQLAAVEPRGGRNLASTSAAAGTNGSGVTRDLRDDVATLEHIASEVAVLQWRLHHTSDQRERSNGSSHPSFNSSEQRKPTPAVRSVRTP